MEPTEAARRQAVVDLLRAIGDLLREAGHSDDEVDLIQFMLFDAIEKRHQRQTTADMIAEMQGWLRES
jgi:hypothetical protein